jgi:5-methyltetrahydrofolate--homocysteine methyltransferase
VHTAVKIDLQYTAPVVHVLDASRAVGVAGQLVGKESRADLARTVKAEYEQVRTEREGRRGASRLLPLAQARQRCVPNDWEIYQPPQPVATGIQVFADYPLAELRATIDWSPFFHAWKLPGKYPQILESNQYGEEASRLYADAQSLLDRIVADGLLTAHGVLGIFPANAVDDDIEIYTDANRTEILTVSHGLRQQREMASGKPNACLADFVAPRRTGLPDHIGGFVVTAGHGARELAARFAAEHDDYNSILVKALADRLAEAFAERLHQRVRTEFWGYAANEKLTNEELIREKYVGIRPAPGYPACPDHTEKETLFDLLTAEKNVGVSLTENFAMTPAASVSGWYFSHPASHYFGLGKIGKDQITDYALRKDMTVAEVERWLAPNLFYEPETE